MGSCPTFICHVRSCPTIICHVECYTFALCFRAPYKPIIKYPTDTSNFDEVEEQDYAPYQTDDLRRNGHFPEHAFSEFTFRRFFDDGGHARPLNIAENLTYLKSLSLSNNNINNGSHSAQNARQSEERTPQNSYHEAEEPRPSGGNPVYV